ncbi:sensitivity to high expression protein she9 [Podila minutissima]|uniref:Sensitive to high expression protein 9, mitochondrial n=1 Tax=Podila minutissima TaxID=64525 RepID=A0A9P5SEK7_9FUNG|nr:sensitivity to high expression protein she9 [Podila minutissima]
MASNFRIMPSGLARAVTSSANQIHPSILRPHNVLRIDALTTRAFSGTAIRYTNSSGVNSKNGSAGFTEEEAKKKFTAEAAERQRIEAQDAALKEILDSAAAEKKKLEEEMARAAEAKAREVAAAKEAAERAARAVEEARQKAKQEADRLAQEKARQESLRAKKAEQAAGSNSATQSKASNNEIKDNIKKATSPELQANDQIRNSGAAANAQASASPGRQSGSTASSQTGLANEDPLEPFKSRLLPYKRTLDSSTEYLRSVLPDNLRQLTESVKRKDYKDTVAQLSEHLNNFTGYNSINDLKYKVITHGDSLDEARIKLVQAKQAYEDAIGTRSDTQKAINDLLQRKHLWSPNDVIRFTDLYRSEHANEQAEQKTKAEYKQAESNVEEKSRRLTRAIMERYHEEQVWSDKIRAASTYGTWGLVTVNVMAFLIVQAFVEPRRRRKQVERYEELVQDLTERGILPDKAQTTGGATIANSATGAVAGSVLAVPVTDSPSSSSEDGSSPVAVAVGGALLGGEDVLLKMMQSAERTEERLDRMETLLKSIPTEQGVTETNRVVVPEEEAGEFVVTEDGSVVFMPSTDTIDLGDAWREEMSKRAPGMNFADQERSGNRLSRMLRDGDEEVPMRRQDFLLTGLGGALLGGLVTVAIMLNR